MALKVNFVLDGDVKEDLERLVPRGKRSRVINDALRKELLAIKRERLASEQDRLRGRTKAVSTREVITAVRRDRNRP